MPKQKPFCGWETSRRPGMGWRCRCMAVLAAAVLLQTCGCMGGDESREHMITIAAVGPMTGPAALRGADLRQAVLMAAAEANAAGGINERHIRVDIYDDGDDPERARELALRIARSTPALAVLGQVASVAGFAAGQVYQAQGIPAITGAASEARVTRNNLWFFRLFQDAAGQGRVLADYARYQSGIRTVAVIREQGTAGEEFAAAFGERAKSQGIRVAADLEFTPLEAKDPTAMAGIAAKLTRLPNGTAFVLGSQYAETPPLLRALRDKLGPFTSFGYSSLATQALADGFNSLEEASHLAPGYYTDNFTVAAPQLGDVAEYSQTLFASRYQARYGRPPNPEAVRWYEGAQLILEAAAATRNPAWQLASGRRQVRDWLAARDRPESAAPGLGGPIYFDPGHNAARATTLGFFSGGRLVSAPVQLTPIINPDQVPGLDRLQSNGLVVQAGETRFVKTPVVYAGIELNTLDNIDLRANSFAADFFLWLRYSDQLLVDPHEVEFPSAISGAQLGKEVSSHSRAGFTTVTYHVKGVFRSEYELSRFPFDEQTLRIPIQFHNSNSYTILLAYGGAQPSQLARSGAGVDNGSPSSVLTSRLWRLKNELFYRDVVAYKASFGTPESPGRQANVEVNRINAAVTIRRDVAGFAIKNFLPLVCILVAVLVGYAIAPDVINPRVSIGVTALLTTSVLYQKLAGDLPTVTYITAMDYVFFAYFGFCTIFLLLTVLTYETHRAKRPGLTKVLNRAGVVLTGISLAATLTFVWLRYWGRA